MGLSSPPPFDLNDELLSNAPRASDRAEKGFMYRIPTPVIIKANYDSRATTTEACRLASLPVVNPITTIVPDSRRGQELRVEAAAGWLTTTTIGLTFTNGILTDRSVQQPSELLALVGIPANIINQYVSILTNFIKLRVDYSTADAAIAKQRAEILASQITQLQSLAQVATAGATADAKGQIALLEVQQKLQELQRQLAQPDTP